MVKDVNSNASSGYELPTRIHVLKPSFLGSISICWSFLLVFLNLKPPFIITMLGKDVWILWQPFEAQQKCEPSRNASFLAGIPWKGYPETVESQITAGLRKSSYGLGLALLIECVDLSGFGLKNWRLLTWSQRKYSKYISCIIIFHYFPRISAISTCLHIHNFGRMCAEYSTQKPADGGWVTTCFLHCRDF